MTDLSGLWEGVYVYTHDPNTSVSFDVELKDEAGQLSGLITEPNTFDRDAGPLLTSVLSGQWRDDLVTFKKTYVGEGEAQHSVHYTGRLSKENTHILGHWQIDWTTGKFEMTRLSGQAETVKEQKEELEISEPS